MVVIQLTEHSDEYCPLSAVQSAYRTNFSTETQWLKIYTDIHIAIDQQKITLMILLNLSAAFDTVDHDILLDVLKHDFGVENNLLEWFQSYLAFRSQCILMMYQMPSLWCSSG